MAIPTVEPQKPKLPEAYIYIDLPTQIDGVSVKWELLKIVRTERHRVRDYSSSYSYPSYTYENVDYTSRILKLHFGDQFLSETLEDLSDKAIIATSKILVQRYIEQFRNEILENSEKVFIVPPPKASGTKLEK